MANKDTLVNYFDNNQMIKDRSSYPTKIQSYYEPLSNYIDNIKIVKDGYLHWQKNIEVKKEIAYQTSTQLFRSSHDRFLIHPFAFSAHPSA